MKKTKEFFNKLIDLIKEQPVINKFGYIGIIIIIILLLLKATFDYVIVYIWDGVLKPKEELKENLIEEEIFEYSNYVRKNILVENQKASLNKLFKNDESGFTFSLYSINDKNSLILANINTVNKKYNFQLFISGGNFYYENGERKFEMIVYDFNNKKLTCNITIYELFYE